MIIVVHARHLENLPPLISLLRILKELGEDVLYLGVERTAIGLERLNEIGVEFKYYDSPLVSFKESPIKNIWQKLTRRVRPYVVRIWLWRQIEQASKGKDDVIVWTVEMLAAAFLGNKALCYSRRHIQSLYELGDEMGRSLLGFDMQEGLLHSTIIECEYNRAHILAAEYGLERLPFIMPNKPYAHPRIRNLPITNPTIAEIISGWEGREVYLYQGTVQGDRGCLLDLLEFLCCQRPNAVIAVMGNKTDITRRLAAKYDNFCMVPFVSPPYHLEITSHATVGLACYHGGAIWGLSPLNSVYCAPNKIFEYSGFGIPMLCNDIPGLRYSVGNARAAICLNDITDDSVKAAIQELSHNYEIYSKRASDFFESIDIVSDVKRILEFARK